MLCIRSERMPNAPGHAIDEKHPNETPSMRVRRSQISIAFASSESTRKFLRLHMRMREACVMFRNILVAVCVALRDSLVTH